MKHRVDVPLSREFKMISDRGYDLVYCEGSVTSRGQFDCSIGEWEAFAVKPNLLSYCPSQSGGDSFVCYSVNCLGGKDSIVFKVRRLFLRCIVIRRFALFRGQRGFPSDK